uniref:Uncharacterized protein n=1 Tax=Tetradesmus obliquus TaxID=3088 RepID=A0A383WJB5_TETOB|eukprot:jgi/Sobl393_1/1306/SZX77214.1
MHNASLIVSPLKQLWGAYERQLERRPVLTQMTTSAVLWCSGDVIAQRLEHWEKQQEFDEKRAAAAAAASSRKAVKGAHPSSAEVGSSDAALPPLDIDWRRAVMTGLFGSTFVGPVGHFWYINLDKWCARVFPGGGAKFIAAKVLLDTAAMGPFYVAAFFAWGCALIDFSGMAEFKRKMAVDFLPTLAAEVTLWPVIQGINFTFVPLKHQLLVVNTMTIFDACFMSWSRNQDDWLAKVKGWIGADGAVVAEEQQQQQGKKGSKKQQRQLEVAPLRLEGPGKR